MLSVMASASAPRRVHGRSPEVNSQFGHPSLKTVTWAKYEYAKEMSGFLKDPGHTSSLVAGQLSRT
jgi:hypothetical protein